MLHPGLRRGLALLFLWCCVASAQAGPLLDRLRSRAVDPLEEVDSQPSNLPAGVQILRDVAYGPDPLQHMDVYLPSVRQQRAPVLLLVHGGAWATGDKASAAVVDHKVAHWLPRGFIVISMNYRLLPTSLHGQVHDVATALAEAQKRAPEWGGDPGLFILMGHSAGAHLAALLTAAPESAYAVGARPWLGAVLLDSAALDVVQIMQNRHLRLYDRAFGTNMQQWTQLSPWHQLSRATMPMLAVCSTRRTDSCSQAQQFVDKVQQQGGRASRLPMSLSHREINQLLGDDVAYTQAVEAFMASLAQPVAVALGSTH